MSEWPHTPVHQLSSSGAYFITAATYKKAHHFNTHDRLKYLHDNLLQLAIVHDWTLQAWAVFSNHYHFIGVPKSTAEKLPSFIGQLHSKSASFVNGADGTIERQVWWNYWDTHLTYPRSYYARLNYVNQNPVKHGITQSANSYPWCSESWFEMTTDPILRKTVESFKIDNLKIYDDF